MYAYAMYMTYNEFLVCNYIATSIHAVIVFVFNIRAIQVKSRVRTKVLNCMLQCFSKVMSHIYNKNEWPSFCDKFSHHQSHSVYN